jgi:hypothetical protein
MADRHQCAAADECRQCHDMGNFFREISQFYLDGEQVYSAANFQEGGNFSKKVYGEEKPSEIKVSEKQSETEVSENQESEICWQTDDRGNMYQVRGNMYQAFPHFETLRGTVHVAL